MPVSTIGRVIVVRSGYDTGGRRAVSAQPVVYAELLFTQHAFDMLGSARAAHTAIAVEQFLAEIYLTQRHATIQGTPR
jgi:hypothetical protein